MSPVRSLAVLSVLSVVSVSCGNRGGPSSVESKPEGDIAAPSVQVVKVKSQRLSMKVQLPGELDPYEVVTIYPKVTGFVEWIGVDRGSRVRKGELIIRLAAPELTARRSEA